MAVAHLLYLVEVIFWDDSSLTLVDLLVGAVARLVSDAEIGREYASQIQLHISSPQKRKGYSTTTFKNPYVIGLGDVGPIVRTEPRRFRGLERL